MQQPVRGAALTMMLLIVALWGANSVAVRFSVDTLPPVAVAGVRFAMGTVIVFAWSWYQRESLRVSRRELWVSLVAGFLLFSQIATFNVGVLWTNSTHAAMLINTFPFFVTAIEHWITRTDRLTARRFVGMAVAGLGVMLVLADENMRRDWRAFLAGDLVLLVSSVLLAIRIVYVANAVRQMSPTKLLFWHDVFAVLMFGGWSVARESFHDARLTLPSGLGLLYQGVVIAGFCFIVHTSLLRHYTASQLSVFSFAAPLFGVVFSILLRGEPLTLAITGGAAAIAFGIWAVNRDEN